MRPRPFRESLGLHVGVQSCGLRLHPDHSANCGLGGYFSLGALRDLYRYGDLQVRPANMLGLWLHLAG